MNFSRMFSSRSDHLDRISIGLWFTSDAPVRSQQEIMKEVQKQFLLSETKALTGLRQALPSILVCDHQWHGEFQAFRMSPLIRQIDIHIFFNLLVSAVKLEVDTHFPPGAAMAMAIWPEALNWKENSKESICVYPEAVTIMRECGGVNSFLLHGFDESLFLFGQITKNFLLSDSEEREQVATKLSERLCFLLDSGVSPSWKSVIDARKLSAVGQLSAGKYRHRNRL
jgi:hypothetical protein